MFHKQSNRRAHRKGKITSVAEKIDRKARRMTKCPIYNYQLLLLQRTSRNNTTIAFLSLLKVYLVGTSYALCAHSFPDGRYALALPGRCVYYNSLHTCRYSHDNALGEYTLMNATYAFELSLLSYDAVLQRGPFPSDDYTYNAFNYPQRGTNVSHDCQQLDRISILILLYSRAYMEQCDIKLIEIFATSE